MTDRSERPNLSDDEQPTPRKVKIPRSEWMYIIKSTFHRFSANQATDLAATLTYYTVLALFPGLLAIVSMMKLSGIGDTLVPALTQLIEEAVPDEGSVNTLVGIIEGFFSSAGAGFGLVIGILTAMWAASGYVAAFSRAMNKVHEVDEGRNAIKLKIQQLGITAAILISVVLLLIATVLSGDFAHWLGDRIGLGETAVTVWNIAKWPVMLAIVMIIIAGLYHWTPNVKMPKFQPISPGSVLAVLVAIVAVAGFSFYAGNFASYDATYGTLAGVIIALWLLWLTNVAFLLGAHLDEEIVRVRQLHRGMPAERDPLLPPREDAGIIKKKQADDKMAAEGHKIRVNASDEEAAQAEDGKPTE